MLPAIPSLRRWSCPCPVTPFSYLAFSFLILPFLPSAASGPRWDTAQCLCFCWIELFSSPPGCHRGGKGWTVTVKREGITFKSLKNTADKTGRDKWKVDLAAYARRLLFLFFFRGLIHPRAWQQASSFVCPRLVFLPALPWSDGSGQRSPQPNCGSQGREVQYGWVRTDGSTQFKSIIIDYYSIVLKTLLYMNW